MKALTYYIGIIIISATGLHAQNGSVTFEYNQANGNRMERVIHLGKDLETIANFNDSLQGEPELPKPMQETQRHHNTGGFCPPFACSFPAH